MIWIFYLLFALAQIVSNNRNSAIGGFGLLVMTPSLIATALLVSPEAFSASTPLFWVIAALLFGYCGEWVLKLNDSAVPSMFILHTIAYICYSKAIWMQLDTMVSWWLPIVVISVAVIVILLLLPILDKVLLPVIVMGIMMLQLLSVSAQVWLSEPSLQHVFAMSSSVLFILAGLFFAISKNPHVAHKRGYSRLTMTCYSCAQLGMVVSVV